MEKNCRMTYLEVLDFAKEMGELYYIIDSFGNYINGDPITFYSKVKNLYVICNIKSGSMIITPYVPSLKTVDLGYSEEFYRLFNEIYSAKLHIDKEVEILKEKFGKVFTQIKAFE